MRIQTLIAAAITSAALGGLAVAMAGEDGPSADFPVVVGDDRVPASEARDVRTADRAIEAAWVRGEARKLNVTAEPGAVADALAAGAKSARQFAQAFDGFHERWRARTRCVKAVHDPFTDRCSDQPAAAAGSCRWMGDASVCELRQAGAWLLVGKDDLKTALPADVRSRVKDGLDSTWTARLRTRARAIGAAIAIHQLARSRRERSRRLALATRERADRRRRAAAERRARQAEAAARRVRVAAERKRRLAEPGLSDATRTRAKAVCRGYERDIDPYRFGAGLQDLEGQSEGFYVARYRALKRLPKVAADRIDRDKLAPLLKALARGNRVVLGMRRASRAGDLEAAYGLLSTFDRLARREAKLVAKLGLGRCLASPTTTPEG